MNRDDRRRLERGNEIEALDREMTRRHLLKGTAVAGIAVGFGGILAACGGSSSGSQQTSSVGTTAVAGQPKRGGVLRVASVGAGKGETFDPARSAALIDCSRSYNLYDPLVRVNPDFSQSPGLALEWNPNTDSTVYEIKLRPDVTFHNGKSFTADDVIFTLRSMGDPKHAGHAAVTNVRLSELKKLDPLTLRVPLKNPDARLSDQFVQQNDVVIQDGETNFSHPVGTGPFMFQSFTPGERSVCKRNPSYWEEGKPYFDEWHAISIDDDAARLNALKSGQIDAMSQLPFVQAKALQGGGDINVVNAPSPAYQVILMAVDRSPFRDKRVRQAMRLIADRQALIDGALAGFGTPGNDLFGKGLPYFADDLPVRQQDLEQAKSLLKAAGQENLTVTLHTSGATTGFVEAATLFAQQAKGAGVNIKVKEEPANAYFDTSLLYTHLNFAQSYWAAASLAAWYQQALLSDAVWNETHFGSPAYDKMITQAIGAKDEATAKELWHKVQQVQYDEGGYLGWANQNTVDAAANYVKGVIPSAFFNLGGWDYRNWWFEK